MKRSLILLSFLAALTVHPNAAQMLTVPVALPIHGHIAYAGNLPGTRVGPGDNQLFTIDTFTGEVEVLMQRERSISNAIWRPDGNALALLNSTPDPALGVYNIELQSYSDILITPGKLFFPQSWSPDGAQILGYEFGAIETILYYHLQLVNVSNGAITPLFAYSVDNPVTDVPVPQEVTDFQLSGMSQAEWNPVYPEWLLIQYDGYDNSIIDVGSGYPSLISPTFIFNIQTDEKLSLDTLFAGRIQPYPVRWSLDGQLIILETNKGSGSVSIIRFENVSGTWNLHVVAEVETIRHEPELLHEVAIDWLGVSDLLLTSAGDQTDDTVFNIAQIINGVWHTTEFVRIPDGTFERKRDEDWHLSASAEERRALTCLFDQAMPSRLSIGTHARVNFTDGTPLRLRTEPDLDAAEIMQMPEGTEFEVIGGPACVNGEQYYRFWQVQLSDSTIGWAAEAHNSDYFVEP